MEHLIPQAWFTGLHWSVLLVIVIGAMGVLIKGADLLVEGASGLAYRLGMPKVIVGATIVSLGTTSPECAVSVMAAWGGNAGLALGNAVGSIIADTALIFGLGALMCTLPADRFVLNRQGWVQFGSAALLALVCYAAFFGVDTPAGGWAGVDPDIVALPRIERWVGGGLLVLLGGYMWISVRWARQHTFGEPFQTPEGMGEGVLPHPEPDTKTGSDTVSKPVAALIAMVIIGLAVVIVSSHVLIASVTELANQFGVPQDVIAATLVAFGTSLPELVVGIVSIRKGHAELLVGNVIGADILNVLFVIGAAAIAAPLPIVNPDSPIPELFLYMHLPTMLGVLVLFRLFIFRAAAKGHFARWNGVPLIAIYVGYVVVSYMLTRPDMQT